ncbi:MAG: acyltransferase [Bacteroidales bacterium]|nr:acyltransferase [Bacteroidales bacterium]
MGQINQEDYNDIAPYGLDVFRDKVLKLVEDPGLEHAVKYVIPDIDYDSMVEALKQIRDPWEFQDKVMRPFIEMVAQRTTAGITSSGLENVHEGITYTFITNHRDIVLDAAFLNLCFMRTGRPTSEVAIGDNLLITDWITHLVRINQSFIVKRSTRMLEALNAAKHLSGYIHYCLDEKKRSVWIAQREGRAKDSNDLTQESLVKMLTLGGGGTTLENLLSARLLPVSISYEYDPNDYLKAREFLLRRNNPQFKKSQRDDLFSMETGLLGYKGRVHFTLGECINPLFADIPADSDRSEIVRRACGLIDREIHCGYMIFPINYIAYDEISGEKRFAADYTEEEVKKVDEYIDAQLAKVDLPDLTPDDYAYMRQKMLEMYANPLTNKLRAQCLRSCPND